MKANFCKNSAMLKLYFCFLLMMIPGIFSANGNGAEYFDVKSKAISSDLIEKIVDARISQVKQFQSGKNLTANRSIPLIDKSLFIHFYSCQAQWLFDDLLNGDTIFISEQISSEPVIHSWYFSGKRMEKYLNSRNDSTEIDCDVDMKKKASFSEEETRYIHSILFNKNHFMDAQYHLDSKDGYYFTSMIYVHDSNMNILSIISSDRLEWK
jgi:hypothetical protein